ncbi:MAG: zinc metallopeptidase [Ruminococcaceae bacterium]|nr:zinc metallopeptidase [Oscillospiraceae bacterium]
MLYYYPFYFYYNNDPLYAFAILLLVVALIITLIAQIRVKTSFSKYSKVFSNLTGSQAAKRLLESQGVYNVKIERCSGNLTDHFDPRTNVIRLSDNVYDANSVAAVGVACHEAGHALQYAKNYSPIKLRTKIVTVTNFASNLAMPLILLGLIFSFYPLSLIGVAFFGLSTLFQLITLPVELNASRRAITAIKENNILLDEYQQKGAKKVLSAAALTYLGALLVSLAQLLRLFAMVNRRK